LNIIPFNIALDFLLRALQAYSLPIEKYLVKTQKEFAGSIIGNGNPMPNQKLRIPKNLSRCKIMSINCKCFGFKKKKYKVQQLQIQT
jgi:hypothetical protein